MPITVYMRQDLQHLEAGKWQSQSIPQAIQGSYLGVISSTRQRVSKYSKQFLSNWKAGDLRAAHTHLKPIPGAHDRREDGWFSHPMGAKHFARQYCLYANVGYISVLFTAVCILRKTQEAVYTAQRNINRHLTKIKLLFITKYFLPSFFILIKFPTEFLFQSSQQSYFSNCSKSLKPFKIIKVQTQFLSTSFQLPDLFEESCDQKTENQIS